MAEASLLEEPLVVHTRPAIDMDDEQFFQFCQLNGDLQIERTAEGDILLMAPEGGSSGFGGDLGGDGAQEALIHPGALAVQRTCSFGEVSTNQ